MSAEIDLRYPIGKFSPNEYSNEQKTKLLNDIKFLPTDVEMSILNLDEHQLDTPYREGGWTVKQLVHHIADSHINAYIRFKLGLTEENPTIKPYEENDWVQLDDINTIPINVSITLLHALHQRWYAMLVNKTENELKDRTIYHPEQKKTMSLWFLLDLYAWHGKHHVAHIRSLRERNNW